VKVPTKEDMVSAIENYCRHMVEKDKDAWLSLFREDATHEDPVGRVMNAGLEKIAAFWDSIQPNDVELRVTETPIVCGNEALVLMQARLGPPDARRESGRIIDQFVFDEAGKIKALRAFYNYST